MSTKTAPGEVTMSESLRDIMSQEYLKAAYDVWHERAAPGNVVLLLEGEEDTAVVSFPPSTVRDVLLESASNEPAIMQFVPRLSQTPKEGCFWIFYVVAGRVGVISFNHKAYRNVLNYLN